MNLKQKLINKIGISLFSIIIFSCSGLTNKQKELSEKQMLDSTLIANEICESDKEIENINKVQKENRDNQSNNSQVSTTDNSINSNNLNQISNTKEVFIFTDDQSVYQFLSYKTFYSEDRSISIQISNIIQINGQSAYYNLSYRMISSSVAMVRGESMTNPDGVITIYIYTQSGCIESSGDRYCS